MQIGGEIDLFTDTFDFCLPLIQELLIYFC
jgi:hypothetical protein